MVIARIGGAAEGSMSKLMYSVISELSENENTRVVQLSACSFSLLMSLVSKPSYDLFYWSELTELERDTADAAVSNAPYELMKVYECPTAAGGGNVPVGAILPFMGSEPPENWMKCDGTLLDGDDYPELRDACYGTYYDPVLDIIVLPDLRGRVPFGYDRPAMPIGWHGGEEMHQLTVTELPNHMHPIVLGTTTGQSGTGIRIQGTASDRGELTRTSTLDYGSGLAHNNMPPFEVVSMYIVRVRPDDPEPA